MKSNSSNVELNMKYKTKTIFQELPSSPAEAKLNFILPVDSKQGRKNA